jgi:methionyl-tRNA synthetase
VRDANVYIDAQEPWVLRKTDAARMETVLHVLAEVIRCVTVAFQPLMPDSTGKILDQLGVPEGERGLASIADEACWVKGGGKIDKPQGVFPRIDVPEEAVAEVIT